METLLLGVAVLFLLIGLALSIIGVLGFWRFPNVYTRLHATGKVSVFGLVSLLIAAAIATPLNIGGKAILLIFFVLLGAPAVSHAIASAAYKAGLPIGGKRDDLKGKLERGSGRGV